MIIEFENQEKLIAALDQQVENHLDYLLTDPELLGQMLIKEISENPCYKIFLKNILRNRAQTEVVMSLGDKL